MRDAERVARAMQSAADAVVDPTYEFRHPRMATSQWDDIPPGVRSSMVATFAMLIADGVIVVLPPKAKPRPPASRQTDESDPVGRCTACRRLVWDKEDVNVMCCEPVGASGLPCPGTVRRLT